MKEHLERLAKGEISVEEAEKLIRLAAIEEVERVARLDVNREERKGIPEVILAEGKDPHTLFEIAKRVVEVKGKAIISRAEKQHFDALASYLREGTVASTHVRARMIVLNREGYTPRVSEGKVGVLSAGTSDIPVAEEARIMASEVGCEVLTAYDVGVAGVHRVFPALKKMIEAEVDALVVVAGMEGALPSVVAGLVDIPVIGVPTSVGYGLGGNGSAALMAMLQACSLGIAVVNIDGGVAGGAVAALIAARAARRRRGK